MECENKALTNADKIKALTCKELAELFYSVDFRNLACENCKNKNDFCAINSCIVSIEAWLNSPAEN